MGIHAVGEVQEAREQPGFGRIEARILEEVVVAREMLEAEAAAGPAAVVAFELEAEQQRLGVVVEARTRRLVFPFTAGESQRNVEVRRAVDELAVLWAAVLGSQQAGGGDKRCHEERQRPRERGDWTHE